MASDLGGVWRTIGGRRVFIKDGEDLATAMKNSGKFKKKKEEEINNKNAKKELTDEEIKKEQLKIINEENPMRDEYHTGIRSVDDIKTPEEAFKTKIDEDEDYIYPDFTKKDGERALETGKIVVYSSKEIKQGGFVSTSKMMAEDYAGGGKIYEQEISIKDVAWIDSSEGQIAKVNINAKDFKDYSKLTRKEMATMLVDEQIKRGVIKPESRERQIQARLTGQFKMSEMELRDYIKKYFK